MIAHRIAVHGASELAGHGQDQNVGNGGIMKRWSRVLLIMVLTVPYLLAFTVVHEVGHTVLARLLGDPDSTFFLVRVGPGGQGLCLGCNITDHSRLSAAGNLAVSLAGLLSTQLVAFLALSLLSRAPAGSRRQPILSVVALGFAFLDVLVQVTQGLLYDIQRHTWPTDVDLLDAMLLISMATGAGQGVLKLLLGTVAVTYLALVWTLYRRLQARPAPGGRAAQT